MINIVYSQWLRTKRTAVRTICWGCPVLYVVIFCLYLQGSNALRGVELFSFYGLYAIVSSFAISFFIPMLYAPDKDACLYANELRIGIKRSKNVVAKFLLIIALVALIEIIASLLFVGFLVVNQTVKIQLLQLVTLMLIPYISLLPMIVIYQFLALKFSYSGSILVGCFTTLASILLGSTGLGDTVWQYLPFTWPVRLIFSYAHQSTLAIDILANLGISVVLAIVLLRCLSMWYNKWDGITKMEQ